MSETLHSESASNPVRSDAKKILAASTLPEPAKDMIAQVVRRTRLWRREKAAVASELVAHFEDGLEAGRSADDLLASFGEVKTTARLIRRGKVRNRPLWWRVQRRMCQTFIAFVLLYIGAAGLMILRHPSPSVDYVAELNRPILATPPADRAWPIYRDALTKARMWELNEDVLYLDGKGRSLHPGDAGWPATVAFLRQQKPLLDAVRAAGLKPSLGQELRSGGIAAMSLEDRAAFGRSALLSQAAPTSRADRLLKESLLSVVMPPLAHMRAMANLVASDMSLAASEDDADRVLADYRALTGMARQTSETPILINHLVGLGIFSLADETLMQINHSTPASLGRCRVELLHLMASAEPVFKMDSTGQRMYLMDIIQRVYSDNGHGDGSPTIDGLEVLTRLSLFNLESDGARAEAVRVLAIPAAVAAMASRRELTEQADRIYALGERDAARPLWVKLHSPASADALLIEWRLSPAKEIRYGMLTKLLPSLNRIGETVDRVQALHEAIMVALALEAYRHKTGQYPATLSALVPHYLPMMPLDYSTGGPLQYKLVAGKPLLYGLGKNGVDDGGVWPDKKAYWPGVPYTGDWVLYPPVETE